MKVEMVEGNFTVKIHGLREAASHLAYREEGKELQGRRLRGEKNKSARNWVALSVTTLHLFSFTTPFGGRQ